MSHPICSALILLAILTLPASARAQTTAAEHLLTVNTGVVDLDLSGTGLYWGMALRGTRAIAEHLGLEAGALLTRYDSAPDATTLVVPELQLQYHWRIGPTTGFAGGGPGLVWSRRYGQNDASLSLAATGGVRAPLNERLALVVEMRLRGVGRNFSGSTAEVMGGVAWRLGSVPSIPSAPQTSPLSRP